MMDIRKICPLIKTNLPYCYGKDCAWWSNYHDGCVIPAVADNLAFFVEQYLRVNGEEEDAEG